MPIKLDHLALIISLIAGSLSAHAVAAIPPPADAAVRRDEVLDEVVVKGTQLWKLRAAVIQAEDRLLARYNALTEDDDLHIECRDYMKTGTHISTRYCLLKLQERAEVKDASEFIGWAQNWGMIEGFSRAQIPGTPMADEVGIQLSDRQEDYRKNLVNLLQDNHDLRELVIKRADAARRYEAARRKGTNSKARLAR